MTKKHLIGLSTYDFPFACGNHPAQRPDKPFTHPEFIEKAASLGAEVIQIADNHPLDVLGPDELASVKAAAEKHGLVVEVGMRGLEPEKLLRYIDITAALGARLLRCVPGMHETDPVGIGDVAAVLKDLLPVLKEKDIVFGIENHDKFTAAEHEDLMQKLGDEHFGIVFDTTNSLSIEEHVDTLIEHMAAYCVCLHMKDYQIRRFNDGMGLQITSAALGTGRQNIPHIYKEITRRSKYDFNIILESWMTPCATLEESLAQEEAWAKTGLDLMRGIRAAHGA